jgi:hypothetical protein
MTRSQIALAIGLRGGDFNTLIPSIVSKARFRRESKYQGLRRAL